VSLPVTNFNANQIIESSYQLSYHFNENGQCKSLENFVKNSFKEHYQVNLNEFYPLLLNLTRKNIPGSMEAVAGIRCAADGKLFSEHYLSANLEDSASLFLKNKVTRQQIIEVGNFAPLSLRQVPAIITAMIGFFYSAGYACVLFTAVPWVANAFTRLGLPLSIQTEAKASQLPVNIQQQWGDSYYQYKPKVYLGDISLGFHAMQKRIKKSHKFYSLWQEAIVLGQNFNSYEHAA
jgi:hypothetical protein